MFNLFIKEGNRIFFKIFDKSITGFGLGVGIYISNSIFNNTNKEEKCYTRFCMYRK